MSLELSNKKLAVLGTGKLDLKGLKEIALAAVGG